MVLLDGEPMEAQVGGDMLLGHVIESVQRLLVGSGHAIRSVLVDGTELPSWAEETGRSLEKVAEVHVLTAPVQQLLSEVAQSALAYLPSLEAGIAQAAQQFLEGNDKLGSEVLGRVVDGLRWYSTFLADVAALGRGTVPYTEARVRGLRNGLQGVLSAWQAGDYTLLSDLLQLELIPELAESRDWLRQWVFGEGDA